MVYRGKPSAGCEACRKAKKRCTLEQPSCARCVKLRKDCSGYRDTTQLQIQDESEAVRAKAIRQKARQTQAQTPAPAPAPVSFFLEPPHPSTPAGILTPATTNSDSSSGSDTIDLYMHDADFSADTDFPADADFSADAEFSEAGSGEQGYGMGHSLALMSSSISHVGQSASAGTPNSDFNLPMSFWMTTSADDMASTHFFNQFTAHGHWEFMRGYARKPNMDPCLDLAIRACGMAALDNVEKVSIGKDYARSMYVEALGLLNAALRDPNRCKTDESLIAVAMLGYYENLTCDSRESIQSWKAHIAGATQLLKLRGKAQFRSATGRMLFRETRAQIMINCIWDDLEPPSFLWEWEDELEKQSSELQVVAPADKLVKICFDFASVRAQIEKRTISDETALAECNDIDRRMIQWSIDAMACNERWQYTEVEVPDSPHVWNGLVHSYNGHPAPSVWNTYRSIRILVTRSQEHLCRKMPFSEADSAEQRAYFRRVRRQMTDEICAGIPPCLGHGIAGHNNNVLIAAYGSIWPLFFAGTCALERLGSTTWESFSNLLPTTTGSTATTSAASAQAAWIMGRLDYISHTVGLKWATGIAAVLKGDFRMHCDLLPDDPGQGWIERIKQSRRGPKALLEKEGEEKGAKNGPMWVGRDIAIERNVLAGMHKPARLLTGKERSSEWMLTAGK